MIAQQKIKEITWSVSIPINMVINHVSHLFVARRQSELTRDYIPIQLIDLGWTKKNTLRKQCQKNLLLTLVDNIMFICK